MSKYIAFKETIEHTFFFFFFFFFFAKAGFRLLSHDVKMIA